MCIQGLTQKIIFFLILSLASPSFALSNNFSIKNVYMKWCNAISSSKGDAQKIIKYYKKDAILLPTLSKKILKNTHDGLKKYFEDLTSRPNIKCTPEFLITQILNERVAINSGYYEFSYTDKGKVKKIPARFNFIYKKIGDTWLIVNQHSSVLP